MSIQDAARVAVDRWDGRTVGGMDLPTIMVAIAGAESNGWQNDCPGDSQVNSPYKCHGYASWGLWQINIAADGRDRLLRNLTGSDAPCDWAAWLSVPANNGRVAAMLFGDAQEYPLSALRPWTVWWSPDGDWHHDAGDGNGIYRRHLAQAQEAVAAVRAQAAPSPDPSPTPPPTTPVLVTLKPIIAGVTTGMVFLGLFALAALVVGVEEVEGKL